VCACTLAEVDIYATRTAVLYHSVEPKLRYLRRKRPGRLIGIIRKKFRISIEISFVKFVGGKQRAHRAPLTQINIVSDLSYRL